MPSVLAWLAAAGLTSACVAVPTDETAGPAAQGAPAPAARPGDDLSRLEQLTRAAHALSAAGADEAVRLLEEILAEDPDHPMALFLHGVGLLDLGRLTAARRSLMRAVELDPADAAGWAVLARVSWELRRPEEALGALSRCVELEPEDPRHRTSLGMVALELGRFSLAYDELLAAVELDPSHVPAHRALGRLYGLAGESELALRSWRTASALDGSDPGVAVSLGHALRDAGRLEEALAAYERAGRLDEGNSWIVANRASTLLELGRLAAARPLFEHALSGLDDTDPEVAVVHLHHGMLLERLGDLDGAEAAYEEALASDADLEGARRALGSMHLARGERERARHHLACADAAGGLDARLLAELVLLHEEAGAWDEARAAAERVLGRAAAGDAELVLAQAILRLRSAQPEVADAAAAETDLVRLVRGPLAGHAACWSALADAHAAQGEVDEALSALEEVLAAAAPGSPLHAQALAQRAELSRRRGADD